jgi:hypothetical protein
MTKEEKIVDAALQLQQGNPLKDFLDDAEIEEAISMLADVLIATGVRLDTENG